MPWCDPSYAWRQLWHTPLATIFTRTSPNRGSSRSSSSICIFSNGFISTGAVINMGSPLRVRADERSLRRAGRRFVAREVDTGLHELYSRMHSSSIAERTEVSMQHELVAEVVVDCRSLLGEGVTWDAATGSLLWVDMDRQLVHSLDAGGRHREVVPERPVSVVVPQPGAASSPWPAWTSSRWTPTGASARSSRRCRPTATDVANDGRCDPHGRLWVGTVDRSGECRGSLVRVDEGGDTDVMLGGRALSNGIDWSPDGRRCYHADSLLRRIDELHLDARLAMSPRCASSHASTRCRTV